MANINIEYYKLKYNTHASMNIQGAIFDTIYTHTQIYYDWLAK